MGLFNWKKSFKIKNKATPNNIEKMKALQKIGAKIEGIQYETPEGKVINFDTVEELENYLKKEDDNLLDLDSIGDTPQALETVYGPDGPRNIDCCPNCGQKFDTPPTRGRKCPACGEKFVVRHDLQLFNSDLLRPDNAAAAECFRNMSYNGVTVEYAKKIREIRERKWGEANPRDLIWDIMRLYPQTLAKDPLKMFEVSSELDRLVAMYEDTCGRDPRPLLKAHIEQNIEQCKMQLILDGSKSDYIYVMSEYCCDTCRQRHGKKIRIKDAKEKMPIPFSDCQNKLSPKSKYHFCRAYYTWFDPNF